MQVLPTRDQFGGDTMRAVRWSEGQEAPDTIWFSGRMQLQGPSHLPLPKQFISPHDSGLQENLHFVYTQLGCHAQEATAFAKLESLAGRVHDRSAAEPIIESPESRLYPGEHVTSSPPDSPPVVVRPLEMVTSPEPFKATANQDASISSIALEALEGSLSACAHLMLGRNRAGGLRPLALHRCLLPLADAGVLRARIELFVRHHDTLVHQGSPVDATQAAFSRGVRMVLQMHRVLLRTCMSSILARRAAEAGDADSYSDSTHATVLEILQHTRSLREQVKFLGDLCWCHVDEKRVWRENEKVPMKWETAPFPKFAALLDHVHAELAECTSTNAHMCRFLLTECTRPLLSQLFHWTHSADGTYNTCLSMLIHSHSQLGLSFRQSGVGHSTGLEQWPTHSMQLQLPSFLISMHDMILLTGLQMRYLASLQQCTNTVPVLVNSALRQVQQVNSAVALCKHEPSSGLDSFTAASDIISVGGYTWTTSIGWQWETVHSAQQITHAGALERQAAADAMLWDLDETRKAAGNAQIAARVAMLQERQQQAAAREQEQAQAAHETSMQRAALLQQRLLEIDSHQAQRLASEQEKQQEEDRLMQGWMWDRSVGDSIRLAAEVKQLLMQSTSMAQRETRMVWRLQRWELSHSRQQLLEKTKQEEEALMAHHKRRQVAPSMSAVPGQGAGSEAPKSVAASTESSQLSLPRTFLLSSRSRARRLSGQASMRPLNTRASMGFLETLAEDSASMRSAAMAPSESLLSQGGARLLPWTLTSSRSETADIAARLIPEEPQHAVPASTFADHSTEVVSQAAESSYGALSVQDKCEAHEHHTHTSFSGAPSAPASTGGASQHDDPFLSHTESQSEYAAPARSIFSGSSGTRLDRPAPRLLSGRVADVMSSLSSAASTAYRPSQGGQSTVASASSTSSLRKQWIPVQSTGAIHQTGEPAEQPARDSNLALGYVPPTVALEVFIHEPIYAQYRLTSHMCMRIARNELQLLQVSQVLQDVLLGGRTTVVNAVVDSIKHQLRLHQEVRAARLQEDLQDAATEALSAYDTPGADALHGMQFGVVLDPSRHVSAASVKQESGIDSEDELLGIPASPQPRRAGDAANKTTATISLEAFDLASLDAVQVTCSMPPVLQMLIPAAALRFHADVFSVLLRTRWATMHLQRLLLLLHKAVRRQPAPHRLTESSSRAAHRLRLMSDTLQVAQHTASEFETHLYMGILQPACVKLREKLSTDMDVRQCALSYIDFGADCALQCLLASDAQLSVVVANMFSLCQHATSTVAELLLHVAVEELERCEAASFTEVAERVLDEDVWKQLQEMMKSFQTRVSFVKDRLSAVGLRGAS